MDETEDYKKEIRTLEEEIEEMQDNFREEQADEYRDLKRELEQTAKNCRVLQFKLKKAERRSDVVSDLHRPCSVGVIQSTPGLRGLRGGGGAAHWMMGL